MLTLYHSRTSPFARKVTASAHMLGLADGLRLVPSDPHPVDRDAAVVAVNPLGKVPTLLLEDGTALYDSRVIVDYLAGLVPGQTLLPERGAERYAALRRQALGDGLLDAALLIRYEILLRPEATRAQGWITGQFEKIASALAAIDAEADRLAGPLTIGSITYAVALGYLDFRFPEHDWRGRHPRAAAWFDAVDALPPLARTRPAGSAPVPQPAALG